jgi:hypothetical protein
VDWTSEGNKVKLLSAELSYRQFLGQCYKVFRQPLYAQASSIDRHQHRHHCALRLSGRRA